MTADQEEIKRLKALIARGEDFIEQDIDTHYNLPRYQNWLVEMKAEIEKG